MNDERMQSLLDALYRDRDEAPRDPNDGIARVMGKVPQIRQRGRWWPLPAFRRATPTPTPTATGTTDLQLSPIPATSGHAPTVIGRTQTMFSPVKAITAGALVFALGGAFLIAQPFDQPDSRVPGAITTEGIGEVTRFEGVMHHGSESVAGVLEALPNGVIMSRGEVWTMIDVELGDPRLKGTVSNLWNTDQRLSGDVVSVAVGGFRIENDDGAWQMRPIVNFTLPDGTYSTWTGVLDGEGDYEGLTAILEVIEDAGVYDVRGIVVDGEVPPPPGSMSAE